MCNMYGFDLQGWMIAFGCLVTLAAIKLLTSRLFTPGGGGSSNKPPFEYDVRGIL